MKIIKKTILIFLVLLGLAIVLFIVYKPPQDVSNISEDLIGNLNNRGYTITGYGGERQMILTPSSIKTSDIRAFQINNLDIRDYMGRTISFDTIYVTDHPLDDDLQRLYKTVTSFFQVIYPNQTKLVMIRCQDTILGGYSFKTAYKIPLLGSITYDIEGRTIEEATGLISDTLDQILITIYDDIHREGTQ